MLITVLTLSKMNPGPTTSHNVLRHRIACARVLISATRSLSPNNEKQVANQTSHSRSKLGLKILITKIPT